MKKRFKKIPETVIRRLPRYYRYLERLKDEGIDHISSRKLADVMELTASQIRQDLNCLGEFGQHGYGYKTSQLIQVIAKTLGIDKSQNVVIIGAGRMGQALAGYGRLNKSGFNIISIFDKNPKVIGNIVNNLKVQDVEEIDGFVENNLVDVGIICISNDEGPMVAEKLANLGIKAIWNFSPVDIKPSENVIVENVHLIESLTILSYKLREKKVIDGMVDEIIGD